MRRRTLGPWGLPSRPRLPGNDEVAELGCVEGSGFDRQPIGCGLGSRVDGHGLTIDLQRANFLAQHYDQWQKETAAKCAHWTTAEPLRFTRGFHFPGAVGFGDICISIGESDPGRMTA